MWRGAMRGVRAWREQERDAPAAPAPDIAEEPATAARKHRATGKPGRPKAAERAHAALVPGKTVGLDRRLADRLKRGRLPIEATLDLHGLTQQEAHGKVQGFIARAAERGLRTVLIVTGKGRLEEGGGVLRAALPRWLNEAPARALVLALAAARPEHGGTGALYVLLRRRR